MASNNSQKSPSFKTRGQKLIAGGTRVDADKMIKITVKNIMKGEVVVNVPPQCALRYLKAAIAEKWDVFSDKQLLLFNNVELKDEDAPIDSLGIVDQSVVTMNVKMNTGVSRNGMASTNIVLFLPAPMPNATKDLRLTIRGMNNVKNRPKRMEKAPDKKSQIWTPEKQLENELTRNRMKSLIKKKRKVTTLSTPNNEQAHSSNSGSIIHSVASYSPATTPPEYAAGQAPVSPTGTGTPSKAPDHRFDVTEKELKLFFEPAETAEQLSMMRGDMQTPPENMKQLLEIKKKLEELGRVQCKICRKKLPLVEQTMPCMCKKLFCSKHRKPEDHMCNIDYKQTGRSKINKENPKVDGGGTRKAKT